MYLCSSCGLDSESLTKSRRQFFIILYVLCELLLSSSAMFCSLLNAESWKHFATIITFAGVSVKAEKNSINMLLRTRGTFTSLCFVGRNLMLSRVPVQLLKVPCVALCERCCVLKL